MSTTIAGFLPTVKQRRFLFDFVFGVLAPIICLIVDPVVFKGAAFLSFGGLLAPVKIAAYSAIGLGVAALALWLVFRPRLIKISGCFAGIFRMAQVVSFLLALVILPFSIIGIGMAGLGLLGLIPFLTAFVFYHQGGLARADASKLPHRRRSALLGAFAIILIPIMLQWATGRYVSRAVNDLLTNPDAAPSAVSRLRAAFWCGDECFYNLAWNYYKSYKDPARQQYLASAYHDITGGDIRTKITTFSD